MLKKLVLTLSMTLLLTNAFAAEVSGSYTHGDGYVNGDPTRNNLRFEMTSVKSWGLIYGRADVQSFDDKTTYTTTRLLGHYNLKKLYDHNVALAGQLVNQKGASSSSLGLSLNKFTANYFYGVDLYKKSDNLVGDSIHLFAYYRTPELYGFYSEGFIENIRPDNSTYPELWFSQPSVMYKVTKELSIGVEYQLFLNKSYTNKLDETIPQFKVKYLF